MLDNSHIIFLFSFSKTNSIFTSAMSFDKKDCNFSIFSLSPPYHTIDVRRLSTKSSALATPVDRRTLDGLTEWKWYWRNDNKWTEYKTTVSQ